MKKRKNNDFRKFHQNGPDYYPQTCKKEIQQENIQLRSKPSHKNIRNHFIDFITLWSKLKTAMDCIL